MAENFTDIRISDAEKKRRWPEIMAIYEDFCARYNFLQFIIRQKERKDALKWMALRLELLENHGVDAILAIRRKRLDTN